MARTASPRPTYTYHVDHALRVELKVKAYVMPVNVFSSEKVVSAEITTWSYVVKFGSGRALFKGDDFVTFHVDPDTAVVELIKALSDIDTSKLNAVQIDWVYNGSQGYKHVKDVDSILDVPGALVSVAVPGLDATDVIPVDHVSVIHPLTGTVYTNSASSSPTEEPSENEGATAEELESVGMTQEDADNYVG